MAQTVRNLPAMQETRVRTLGQEDPLDTGIGTHSSILAWRIPWAEEPGRLQSRGSQRRSKRLLISWLQSPSAVILEPLKIKSDTVSTVSPSISHKVMGPDVMILVF